MNAEQLLNVQGGLHFIVGIGEHLDQIQLAVERNDVLIDGSVKIAESTLMIADENLVGLRITTHEESALDGCAR